MTDKQIAAAIFKLFFSILLKFEMKYYVSIKNPRGLFVI
jgi:hypothetical protein